MITIKNSEQIEKLRASSRIVVQALDLVAFRIQPGVSTLELDQTIGEFIHSKGARPAFLGFRGYPANSCISIDEQVVHGIPGNRRLKDGEIVSIDIGVELDGFYGDAARTFAVGNVDKEKLVLMQVTKEALLKGIEQARVGNRLYDISAAIQGVVEQAGFAVVRDLVGHGIGEEMHEPPQIPNYGKRGTGPRLKAGMSFAIEPMVNMGTWKVHTLADQWTVVTDDNKPSAHFEHDIVITDAEPDILTI
jgi:methionyl aminopeptidase